jgi:hypothetical protein
MKDWVVYRRTNAVGDVDFFIRTRGQWELRHKDTDKYKREVLMETDDYKLAKKAVQLAKKAVQLAKGE